MVKKTRKSEVIYKQGEPTRAERRFLQKRGFKKGVMYADNMGNMYNYEAIAKLMSFIHILLGCLSNGFPIAVKHLKYDAWAFYPFFFLRIDIDPRSSATIINHERIHCRQQMEIHLCISLPIAVILGILGKWIAIPFCIFIPTIFYYLDWIRCSVLYRGKGRIFIRKQVCFEREAESHSTNLDYLADRKWFSFLGYMGINKLNKFGQ